MKQKLTAKEEMLMNIFWAHEPLFIRDLISHIPDPKPHYNTVATLVKFLEEKGFVEREPMANSSQFVEEDKMDLQELKDLISLIEKNKK